MLFLKNLKRDSFLLVNSKQKFLKSKSSENVLGQSKPNSSGVKFTTLKLAVAAF